MLYVRTAAGSFINAATIIQLSPQRAGSCDEITGWVAICSDGKAIKLAPYYAGRGRIETVLDYMPARDRLGGEVTSIATVPCSSEGCPCA